RPVAGGGGPEATTNSAKANAAINPVARIMSFPPGPASGFRLRPVTRHFARFVPGVEVWRTETLLLLRARPWDRDAPSGARPPHRSTARTPPCPFDRQVAAAAPMRGSGRVRNAAPHTAR